MSKSLKQTYTADIRCRNCGRSYTEHIEKGVEVIDFLLCKECPNCGCMTLEKDYFKNDRADGILEVELPPVAEPKPGDVFYEKVRL